ncbi:MAG: NUDIX hydrolase [Candidatus Cloacimonadaceae bacterium]|jgi:ADP-ribose pyrophosphatase YjhB (NUDIX family)|nr:NUDIX hydrolase [Candidatus Cloacimonadota bacterium]MDY0127250.1 NUDIX hydrolase [Candidatus Cloacimonadaceae bacterium]MCB5254525.1 NUDIX hydrolase [Candidatus Cloacimonadota bacterium]MCK9178278.1 NUDIX hydrolase [Candidatus Cloacimonadota bacterium]MCK9242846.1 NUDIX hydrolase [Candidatus Cloacimonadota bacterium]
MKDVKNVIDLYQNAIYCQNCGGKLELKNDREGKVRAICMACGFILYKNPIPAVAIFVQNEANEILLIKRLCEPQAGMWALPSGYVEIDMTPEQNAIAEMQEETGLIGEVEYCIDWFYGYSPIYLRTLSIGFKMKVIGGILQAGDDAGDARYFALDELPPIAFDAHRHFIKLETNFDAP